MLIICLPNISEGVPATLKVSAVVFLQLSDATLLRLHSAVMLRRWQRRFFTTLYPRGYADFSGSTLTSFT